MIGKQDRGLPGVLASTAVPREAVSHLEEGSVGSAVEPNRTDPGAGPDAWAGEPVLRGAGHDLKWLIHAVFQ